MRALIFEPINSGGCGRITGEFELGHGYNIWKIEPDDYVNIYSQLLIRSVCKKTLLTSKELKVYSNGKKIYIWDIYCSKKYIESMELSELYKNGTMTKRTKNGYLKTRIIRRPPQYWCYSVFKEELVILITIHHKDAELIYSGKRTAIIEKSYPRKGGNDD